MPKYEIKKIIECTLIVECENIEQAQNWADYIVATIERNDENNIDNNLVDLFEAETAVNNIIINKIE